LLPQKSVIPSPRTLKCRWTLVEAFKSGSSIRTQPCVLSHRRYYRNNV
jgi:hypothetical protein